MATFELPEMPKPNVSPTFLMGAASPLWGYYGAAAASGVAYWWMTRWAQPVNLEALLGLMKGAPETAAPLIAPAAEVVTEAAETVVEAGEAAAPELPAALVGGEAAPISPVVEALAPASEQEPVVQAAPEAAAPEPAVDAPPEAEPIRPRARKGPANGVGEQP